MSYFDGLSNQIARLPVKIAGIMNTEKTKLFQRLYEIFYHSHGPKKSTSQNSSDALLNEVQTAVNKAFESATLQVVTLVQSSSSHVIEILDNLSELKNIEEFIQKMDDEIKRYKSENKRLRKILMMTELFQVLSYIEKRKVVTKKEILKSIKISARRLSEILSLLEKEKLIKVDKSKRTHRVLLKKSILGV